VISGICYIFASLSFIISPEVHKTLESYLSIPQTIGEVSVLLWLLIKGVSVSDKKIKTRE
jgi:hypothetical protein